MTDNTTHENPNSTPRASAGSESFDTAHRDYLICPHCGHSQRDAWEIDFGMGMEGDAEIVCGECEQTFMASRHCTLTYSTQKHGWFMASRHCTLTYSTQKHG